MTSRPYRPPNEDSTPPEVFFNRRQLLAALAAGTGIGAWACGSKSPANLAFEPALDRPKVFPAVRNAEFRIPRDVFQDPTPQLTAGTHNNFYEFIPGKAGEVWKLTEDFAVEPWSLEVTGAVETPRTFGLDDIFEFPHEERLYHFRCVERWAMNVPWTGFPLALLLDSVKPLASARYVRLTSASQADVMPGIRQAEHYPWPYHEALRLDEALHPLTLIATGIYGAALPKGHGAPLRLVVPWKYGYKSAKSLVRIEVLEEQPTTFWSEAFPHEYGFLSNVNPNIPHPRWSQERSFTLRIDPTWPTFEDTFRTPIFNGYEADVAHLYANEPRTPQDPLMPGQLAR